MSTLKKVWNIGQLGKVISVLMTVISMSEEGTKLCFSWEPAWRLFWHRLLLSLWNFLWNIYSANVMLTSQDFPFTEQIALGTSHLERRYDELALAPFCIWLLCNDDDSSSNCHHNALFKPYSAKIITKRRPKMIDLSSKTAAPNQ